MDWSKKEGLVVVVLVSVFLLIGGIIYFGSIGMNSLTGAAVGIVNPGLSVPGEENNFEILPAALEENVNRTEHSDSPVNLQIQPSEGIGIQEVANSTSCGTVNSNLTLTSNVNSSGTCFTINASNIVLDCAGFMINYSQSASSYSDGINNTGFSNVAVKGCIILSRSAASLSN